MRKEAFRHFIHSNLTWRCALPLRFPAWTSMSNQWTNDNLFLS